MQVLLDRLGLPRDHPGHFYLCDSAYIYSLTGLDGLDLLSQVAFYDGVRIRTVIHAVDTAVAFLQEHEPASRLLKGRSSLGSLRLLLQICLEREN